MSKQIGFDRLFDAQSFDAGTTQLVKYLNRITEEIDKAKDSASQFAKIMGAELKKEIAQLSSTSANLAKKMQEITQKMNDFKVATSNTKKVISDYEKENEKLRKELENLKKAQQDVTNTTKNKSQVMGQLRQSLLGAGAGAAILYKGVQILKTQISLALKSTIEFEKAMKEVQSISRSTGVELEQLTKNANKLGATTEKTALQIAETQKELAKLGFTASEIISATGAIVDLSTATGEDLASSAVVAASTLRAFKLEATEMGRVVDVMAGSFVRSGLDLEKFRESIKLVAPIASATNINLETTTAMLSKLADAGLSGSLAGTALRNLISSMADPTEDLTKRLGFTVESSEDLVAAFIKLNKEGIGLAEAVQLVDVRARPAFFTLVNQAEAVESLAVQYKYLKDESSLLAEQMRDTLSNDVEILNSAFDSLRRNITEGAIPALRGVTQEMTTLVEFMRFLGTETETVSGEDGFWAQFTDGIWEAIDTLNIFNDISGYAFDKMLESNNIDRVNEQFKLIDETVNLTVDAFLKYNEAVSDMDKTSQILKGNIGDHASEVDSLRNKYVDLSKVTDDNREFLILLKAEKEKEIKTSNAYKQSLEEGEAELQRTIKMLTEYKNTVGIGEEQTKQLTTAEERLNLVRSLRVKITSMMIDTTDGLTDAERKLLAELSLQAEISGDLLDLQNKLNIERAKTASLISANLLKEAKTFEAKGILITDYYQKSKKLAEASYKAEIDQINQGEEAQEIKNLKIRIAKEKLSQELIKIEQKYIDDRQNLIDSEYESFAKLFDKELDETIAKNKESKKQEDDMLSYFKDRANEKFEFFMDQLKEQGDADYDAYQKQIDLEKKKKEAILNSANDTADGLLKISRFVFDNRQQMRQNELDAISAWEDEQVRLAGDNEDAKLRIQEQAEARRIEIKRKQARDNKAEAIFQIILDTAKGIMATIGQTGIFGLPASAIIGALGAAQVATVMARPLPQFAKGTKDSPEGFAEVGERGRELIRDGRTGQWSLTPDKSTITYLSKHSQVIPNAQTEQILKADPNIMADNYLKNKIIEVKAPQVDYDRIGQKFEQAVSKIPINMTNFDERGVTNYVVKRSVRLQRLNKRY